jgi:hypothetical protein
MEDRPIVLVDLEGLLDRHWFGSEPVLRDPIPTLARPDLGRVIARRLELAVAST